MADKLIIEIEGTDCSGKETQSKSLEVLYTEAGYKTKRISLPEYDLPTGLIIKKYLRGEYGDIDALDPYSISKLYINNRFEAFITKWQKYLNDYDIIIFDRYVDSNILYQMPKFKNKENLKEYIDWLYEVEYKINNLPKPDIKIMLKTDLDVIKKTIKTRKNKIDNSDNKDIHEANEKYIEDVYNACLELAKRDKKYNVIECTEKKNFKKVNAITLEIKNIIDKKLI